MKTFSEYINEGVTIHEYNSLSYDEKLVSYDDGESKKIMAAIKKANKNIDSVMIKELLEMAEKDIGRELVFKVDGRALCLYYAPSKKKFSQYWNAFMAERNPKEHIDYEYSAKEFIKLINNLK